MEDTSSQQPPQDTEQISETNPASLNQSSGVDHKRNNKVWLAVGVLVLVAAVLFAVLLLSSLKQKILDGPPQNASPTEVVKYNTLVKDKAISTNELTIGINCKMNPLVLEITTTDVLTIRNDDSIQHVISFEDQNFFTVSANDSRELTLERIGKKPGIYRYRCGDMNEEENVGVLYIIQGERINAGEAPAAIETTEVEDAVTEDQLEFVDPFDPLFEEEFLDL